VDASVFAGPPHTLAPDEEEKPARAEAATAFGAKQKRSAGDLSP